MSTLRVLSHATLRNRSEVLFELLAEPIQRIGKLPLRAVASPDRGPNAVQVVGSQIGFPHGRREVTNCLAALTRALSVLVRVDGTLIERVRPRTMLLGRSAQNRKCPSPMSSLCHAHLPFTAPAAPCPSALQVARLNQRPAGHHAPAGLPSSRESCPEARA